MRVNSAITPGQRFGKWTVIRETQAVYGGRLRGLWDCECACGMVRGIAADALLGGKSTQCRNCSNREKAAAQPRLTHGGTDTRLYNIWMQMKRRCRIPTHQDFHLYGGRGISVCPAWLEFKPFQDWALANGYQPHLTIDRDDNDRGYEPGNCSWKTRAEQNRNRRDNQRHLWRGEHLLLSEIAELEGIPHDILRQRVKRDGLTVEIAVTRPLRRQSPKERKV